MEKEPADDVSKLFGVDVKRTFNSNTGEFVVDGGIRVIWLYWDSGDWRGWTLTGSIPAEIGAFSSLTHLNLSRNELRGEIPQEVGALHSLVDL